MTTSSSTKNHAVPTDRLNYKGDLAPIITSIGNAYNIGMIQGFSVIEVGYEDCNVLIETHQGKYVAKMFNKTRTSEKVERNMMIVREVIKAGVHHPRLILTAHGDDIFTTQGITLTLMEFIRGKTFLELDRAPTAGERRAILEQAARINRIDITPAYMFDSWAIPHIHAMYERVRQYIDPSDLLLVERVLARYDAIPLSKLPKAFVHGDLTKANIIKADDGQLYSIDFSGANQYPRIQELAVIIANLLYEPGDKQTLKNKCDVVACEYGKFTTLTEDELRYLPDYALAGVAMEFMGAHQEKYSNNIHTPETEYWLRLGRDGLRAAV